MTGEAADGDLPGFAVCFAVGSGDGDGDGNPVGDILSCPVGLRLGVVLAAPEGCGVSEGASVGLDEFVGIEVCPCIVGKTEGAADEFVVESVVGLVVEIGDRLRVGAAVGGETGDGVTGSTGAGVPSTC